MKKYVVLLLVILVLGTAGCSINTGISLTNGISDATLGWVYIVPAGAGYDGAEDQLTGTIAPGGIRLFDVAAGTWDVRWGVNGEELSRGGAQDVVVIEGQITPLTAMNN